MSTDEILCNPDDPRLTAYALGELTDPAERTQVEQFLAASPEARAELADIHALSAALTAEYVQERAAAEGLAANVVPMTRSHWRPPAPWLRMAALILIIGLAVGIALPVHRREQARSQRVATAVLPTAPPQVAARAAEPALPSSSPMPDPIAAPATAKSDLLLSAKDQAVRGPASLLASASAAVPAGPMASANVTLAPVEAATAHRASAFASVAQTDQAQASDKKADKSGASTVTTREMLARSGSAQAKTQPSLPAFTRSKAVAAADASKTGLDALPEKDAEAPEKFTTYRAGAAPAAPASKPVSGSILGDIPVQGRLFKQAEMPPGYNTAGYPHLVENPFLAAKENPLSTFSIDMDTASYSIVRRFIDAGSLPPKDAVRVEEMLNYFPFGDAPPAPDSGQPFAIHLEAAACAWNPAHRLVRIGIKAREIDRDQRPPSNLVFLLDVSGSMMPEERLPLIKECLRAMVEKLREDDHVAIVVYAGESGLALPSTSGDHKDTILRAIDSLHAGGSTNGAAGLRLAYQVARKHFIQGGTNRVILSTDGDFNVGETSQGGLLRLIEEERKDGVFLTVLGVGTDNLQDATMLVLADHGNGNYAYIDRLEEGKKVLVNQMSGTLVAVAKDVKIQVEFNPATAAAYRLIGYEKRLLRKEDFNDDRADAGEIGAGQSVTALYEIVPGGPPSPGQAPAVDALKYQPAPAADAAAPASGTASRELLTVKMRQKAPGSGQSERTEEAVLMDGGAPGEYVNASEDFQFAAAVASFGLVLRDSSYKGNATLGSALALAQAGKGEDPYGYRAGFIELVRRTQALQHGEP